MRLTQGADVVGWNGREMKLEFVFTGDFRCDLPLTINGSGVPLRQLALMEPPLRLFGVLQLLPPTLEALPPLMSPFWALRLSPFGRLVMPVVNLSGDGVLLCVSDTVGELLVVRDSGIGELEFRFKLNDGGLARFGDEAAISTGEMVVCSCLKAER